MGIKAILTLLLSPKTKCFPVALNSRKKNVRIVLLLVVVLGLVPQRPETPTRLIHSAPIVLVIVLVLVIDPFPPKGRKSHLRRFRSRLFLNATRYSPATLKAR